jgi:hypothetical protein
MKPPGSAGGKRCENKLSKSILPYRSNIFQSVKELPIDEVLGRYGIELHPTGGGRFTCQCIFHDDHRPSLIVYSDGFHCFACGAHGDTISFVARLLNVRPFEAAQDIARRFGLPVDQLHDRQQVKEQIKAATDQIESERALRAWAKQAYIKLVVLRRACFLVLDEPDAYYCDLMDYADEILDTLQFGSLSDKLAVLEGAKADKLGLPGVVMLA